MFRVQSGHWDKLEQDAKFIRKQVFIIEQNIPEEEEWDDQDMISDHFVVYDQDQPIATARLLQNNSVGRVAVLKAYRGQGIGRMIMLEIIRQAHQQDRKFLQLSSQVHAISFYEKLGFSIQGDAYDECGIPHIKMQLVIETKNH
ncbi:GNAT family N-acetyltransferase [Acinetobacter junii]|jgi:predicted GNAT family N-acyltransferase|uniref:GNAT family N-acetyltransferase n=1 Tax=Acinetobacter junii TaxID=40215 RepID=A0ABU8ZE04_ACIJU|nr:MULTISPECIES: GNAT family N-acetyltransferase [Acinetobacter]MBY3623975.1 GNAT family N-acetyltransferase [Acinetobacter sp. CUI P1]MCL5768255.1 GNAT family N-acetyltransferase [Acinetobacter sp. ANC5681]MDA3509730.1 GNAT family N-acetyltransferase [Acinetobacter junii]MDA3534196.1 GNAT family N-acetyltransferase [Acinetobacter junii]MDH1376233.1 GNAT family N-acetyltransferase [Acinetobacter junii]